MTAQARENAAHRVGVGAARVDISIKHQRVSGHGDIILFRLLRCWATCAVCITFFEAPSSSEGHMCYDGSDDPLETTRIVVRLLLPIADLPDWVSEAW